MFYLFSGKEINCNPMFESWITPFLIDEEGELVKSATKAIVKQFIQKHFPENITLIDEVWQTVRHKANRVLAKVGIS